MTKSTKKIAESDFSITYLVNKTPMEVFRAITNVRGWWSEGVEGGTRKRGDEFIYRHIGMHYSKQKLVEVVPGKKIVWLVTDSYLTFIKDKTEWNGSRIIFDIAKKGAKTELRFIHVGLTPGVECYDGCSNGWGYYIKGSLRNLITKGKGQPDPKIEIKKKNPSDFTTTILVNQTSKVAFNAINNVRGWWSEEIEGGTSKLNNEFAYNYNDVHYCQMKLIKVEPNKKVVWLVKFNYFNFTKEKGEWTGTKVIFDISKKGKQTQIHFTHQGLVPEYECYDICKNAWTQYIQQSLFNLITKGKGQPNSSSKARTKDEKKLKSSRK